MIGPVVDAQWLAERVGRTTLAAGAVGGVVPDGGVLDAPADPGTGRPVVADVRWYLDGRSGRAAYEEGHLPGAVFVDLDSALAAPPSPAAGRHPLPSPAHFAAARSAAGVGDDSVLVAYDDAGGTVAARLVWMLRALGVDAALLDGGIAAWPGPLETGSGPAPSAAAFTARPWPVSLIASADDAADPANAVMDARDPARYRGEVEPIDARPGHVPGAANVPSRSNLGADGRFLPAGELRRRFETAGAGAGRTVISYCGSGVTACHNLLAMELAGLPPGRLYPGSWSQYSADPARPAAVGDEP